MINGNATESVMKHTPRAFPCAVRQRGVARLFENTPYKRWNPDASWLLEQLEKSKPGYLESWRKNFKKTAGRDPKFSLNSSWFVLDHLYKIKLVANSALTNPCYLHP